MQTHFFSRSLPALSILMLIAIFVSGSQNTQNSFASPSHTTQSQVLIQRYGQNILPLKERSITAFTSVTKDDSWIAGTHLDDQNQAQMFFQHFKNGKWFLVPAPPVRGPASIHSIAAISAQDIWAVGSSTTDAVFPQGFKAPAPLIEHWNGQQWSIINSNSTAQGSLTAITILSTKNIWVAGTLFSSYVDHHFGYVEHSGVFFEHFDGSQWEQVLPDPVYDGNLVSITANAPNDVWAIGTIRPRYTYSQDGYSTLIEHFNGAKWRVIPSMNLGTDQYYYNTNNTSLSALSIINSRDIWAVGEVAEHWDGTRWSIVSFPPHSRSNLNTVIALGPKDVWAGNENTFYHWNGFFWKHVSLSPGISQLQNWQRFGKTNTLIGLGTYHDQTYIMTLN